jgi:hypothetical protein
MQQIRIYTVERNNPLTLEVAKVTGGTAKAGLHDTIEYEDEDGNKGWLYVNKESVIAVAISPPIKGR